MKNQELVKKAYEIAKAQYAEIGVDVDAAIAKMKKVNISLHCWQTDDVGGFETPDAALSGGGIQATGNYPGKASTIAVLPELFSPIRILSPLLKVKDRFSIVLKFLISNFSFKVKDLFFSLPINLVFSSL